MSSWHVSGSLPAFSCMQGTSTCLPAACSMRGSLLLACHWPCNEDVAASCCFTLCCAGSTTSGRQGLAPLMSTRCGCGGTLTGGGGSGTTRGTGMLWDAGRGPPTAACSWGRCPGGGWAAVVMTDSWLTQ